MACFIIYIPTYIAAHMYTHVRMYIHMHCMTIVHDCVCEHGCPHLLCTRTSNGLVSESSREKIPTADPSLTARLFLKVEFLITTESGFCSESNTSYTTIPMAPPP